MSLTKQFLKTKPTCKVTFTLPKTITTSKKVLLVGDFNNWILNDQSSMKKMKDGSFKSTMELSCGKSYEFRYVTSDHVWFNDSNADAYVSSPFGGVENSVLDLTQSPELKTATKATSKSTPKKKTTAAKKPVKAKKAAKVKKDDLTKIEGIGPKIKGLLSAAGIVDFISLSKASKKELNRILKEAGPRYTMHSPDTWAKQAKLAAKGDWDKLKVLQEELKGGK